MCGRSSERRSTVLSPSRVVARGRSSPPLASEIGFDGRPLSLLVLRRRVIVAELRDLGSRTSIVLLLLLVMLMVVLLLLTRRVVDFLARDMVMLSTSVPRVLPRPLVAQRTTRGA